MPLIPMRAKKLSGKTLPVAEYPFMLLPDCDALIPKLALIEKPACARQLAETKLPTAKLWLCTG